MKREMRNSCIVSTVFLLVFLAEKLFLSQNPGLPLIQWLADTTPWNHSYLFGWLIMHGRFFYCSLVCIVPALWGWTRLSVAGTAGFSVGLLAGEIYHAWFWTPEQRGIPYSWVIWVLSFGASLLVGAILQALRKKA